MEFPENVATNVWNVSGILFVQWALYTAKSANASDDLNVCYSAGTDLRNNGFHVLYEDISGLLWIFDVSRPSVEKTSKPTAFDAIALILKKYKLKRIRAAALRAVDVVDSSGHALAHIDEISAKIPHNISDMHSPQVQSIEDTAVASKGFSPGVDARTIYEHLKAAIQSSFTSILTRKEIFIPVSPDHLLELPNPISSASLSNRDSDLANVSALSENKLVVRWTSQGLLTLLIYPAANRKWCRLSEVVGSDDQDSFLKASRLVVLAPQGAVATYVPPKENRDAMRDQSQSSDKEEPPIHSNLGQFDLSVWKYRVQKFLQYRGIELPGQAHWVTVRLMTTALNDLDDIPTKSQSCQIVFWPAAYCFLPFDGLTCAEKGQSWFHDHRGGHDWTDALSDVESWYTNRGSRAEAMELLRRQADLEAKKDLKTDYPRNDTNAANDVHYMDVQSAAGIYPTPPDGFNPQLANLSSNDPTENDGLQLASGSPITGANEQNLGENYTPLPGDEFFGTLDTDMFAANDLTEADFSFFDEPDMIDPGDLLGTGTFERKNSNTKDSPPTSSARAAIDIASSTNAHKEKASEYANEREIETSQVHNNAFPSTDHENPQIHVHSSPASEKDIGAHTESDLVKEPFPSCDLQPDLSTRIVQRQTEIAAPDQGMFGAISLDENVRAWGEKYKTQGTFGSSVQRQMAVSSPIKQTYKAQRNLPQIGIHGAFELGRAFPISPPPDNCNESDNMLLDESSKEGSMLESHYRQNSMFDLLLGDGRKSSDGILQYSSLILEASYMSNNGLELLSEHIENPWAYPISDEKDLIQIAQIYTDQIVKQYTISGRPENLHIQDGGISQAGYQPYYQDSLAEIVPSLFPGAENATMQACASMANRNLRPPFRATARKIESLSGFDTSDPIYKIPSPYLQVRRGTNTIDISPVSLPFWEELGLEPCRGSKDIHAMCMYPANPTLERAVEMLFTSMDDSYRSLRLGNHFRLLGLDEYPTAHVPILGGGDSVEDVLEFIDEACIHLGVLLAQYGEEGRNLVIYMIDPFSNPASQARLCASFHKLCVQHRSSLEISDQDEPDDLILKIVPIDHIASKTSLLLPEPDFYTDLAKEMYDRCPPTKVEDSSSVYALGSLHQLAESIPNVMDFRLTSSPPAGLIKGITCIHICYAWSRSHPWLTLAMTDELGSCQWTASFNVSPTFDDLGRVASEILNIALEVIENHLSAYKLFIVKVGNMSKEEIQVWTTLFQETGEPYPTHVLIEANPVPSLRFPVEAMTSTSTPDIQPTYATPESTQATPEQMASPNWTSSMGSALRSGESSHDLNARLVDLSDETWGVHTSQLHLDSDWNSDNVDTADLPNGYLVKRAGSRDEDGLVALGVRIIHAESPSDGLLKEILSHYRGLGVLARARGIVDPVRSVLPWHVAASMRAYEGLNSVMRQS